MRKLLLGITLTLLWSFAVGAQTTVPESGWETLCT